MMPAPVLRIVNPDGTYGRVLPAWTTVEVGGDAGEHMVLRLGYSTDAATWPLLGHGTQIAVLLDGVELGDGRFLLDDQADEEVLDADVGGWSGNSLLFALNYAIVYPESWGAGGNTTTPGWGFAGQTPGQALRELLEAAQARGWNPDLSWDFTDNLDSSGAAWTATIDDFYDHGTTLLDIVVRWKTRKVAVAKMNGAVLQLYRYDTQGVDRSLDVILMRGVDLTEGPVNRSSRNTVSVMLGVTDGIGGAGFGVERVDNPALSTYGRREGFVSQSQIADSSTLAGIVDGTLALKARQREAFTYGLLCGHPDRLPFQHFDRGDIVTLRVKGIARQMRVRQLAVTWDKDGAATGSAAFGDRKMDAEEQLAQRLEQLTGGSMDGGVFGQPIIGAPDQSPGDGGGGDVSPDTMPPSPPTALSASSVVLFEQGYLSATATITWAAPTTNADGSALNDLGGFEVQYRHTGYPLWEAGGRYVDDTTTGVLTRLVVGNSYDWRVRALDIWGNASSWATSTFTATNDVIAPAQTPSTPVVATFLFSGLLITWDGKAAGGTAIDNDTRHVEVHLSTSSGFTPSAGTYRDKIDVGSGQTVIGELTPGTTYYVKFRSVDWAGNLGPSSAQATGAPDSVQTGDVADGAITDAKIGTLSATKITAGTITAVITQAGTIQTAASGARVVINSAGVKLFDAASNVTVALNSADGTATFNGVLGAANITGYVRVVSGTSQVILQNVGGIPTVTLTTGRLIEKYPAYLYCSNDAFMRSLSTAISAPGSQYAAGSGAGFTYDYTSLQLYTIVYDGDFANATTLPTRMWGRARIVLPINTGSKPPQLNFESRWAAWATSNDFHLYPALIWSNGHSAQHEVGLRLDHTGSDYFQARLSVVCNLGQTAQDIGAASFTIISGTSVKEEITEVPYSAVDVILANPAKRWRYIDGRRFEIGPMADRLPDEVRDEIGEGYGAYPDRVEYALRAHSMTGLVWKAVEELAGRLADLEGRVDVRG